MPGERTFRTLMFYSLVLHAMQGAPADPLDSWQWRNPLPTANSFNGIIFVGNAFVAVGDVGSVLVSLDGIVWNTKTTRITSALRSIAYGNGTYVAVGDNGVVLNSTDLENWTLAASGIGTNGPIATNLTSVSFGNGVFVAVGYGVIIRSTDGSSWTSQNVAAYRLRGVAYGSGIFAAAGDGNALLTSPDGSSWTVPSISAKARRFYGIAYANNRFVAISFDFSRLEPSFLISTNGLDWIDVLPKGSPPLWMTSGNGRFVVATGGNGDTELSFSEDGLTWINPPVTGLVNGLQAGTYGNGMFVFVGGGGLVLTSPNGTNWATQSSGSHGILTDLAQGNGQHVAVGGYWAELGSYPTTSSLMTSTDGRSFATNSAVTAPISRVIFANNTFLAVGFGGVIFRSPDATS